LVRSDVSASALAEATGTLAARLERIAERFMSATDPASTDVIAKGLLGDDLLLPGVHRARAVLSSHGHDDESGGRAPRGQDDQWLENEVIESELLATLRVLNGLLVKATMSAGRQAPNLDRSAGDPKTLLNSALGQLESTGRQFLDTIEQLEKQRALGRIPPEACKPSMIFVRREDPAEMRLDLEVVLAEMEHEPAADWERARGIAARCVLRIVRAITDAKHLIDSVREFTDNPSLPELERWSSQLRLELDATMDALKLGDDRSAWTPPLASALGAGVGEAVKRALTRRTLLAHRESGTLCPLPLGVSGRAD